MTRASQNLLLKAIMQVNKRGRVYFRYLSTENKKQINSRFAVKFAVRFAVNKDLDNLKLRLILKRKAFQACVSISREASYFNTGFIF